MERRLSAILAADVVGYTRLMAVDEEGTLDALKSVRTDLIEEAISRHSGRIFKLTGDGLLAEFPSVVNAASCAVELQRRVRDRNSDIPSEKALQFRMGVHLGDVIVDGEDIYGDGVNLAARLEGIAPPGGIAISESVREHVGNRLELEFEDLGEQTLKNVEKPVRVYSLTLETPATSPTSQNDTKTRPSVAVLPFNNMSGDPEQEYFSDGMTEDIITDLSKISGLFVVARHTAFTYKNKPVKVQQVGQELKVGHILEGSVRKAGQRVRVTGQLTRASDGEHLWADRFDRDLTDIFAIQDEITHAIVEQLKVKLLAQEKDSIERPPTDNIDAYNYYLKGRQLLHRGSVSGYKAAREMFVKAVELDPGFARAYAGIADCDSFLFLRTPATISPDSILATSDKALALDNNLPEAHAARGNALSVVKRYEEAEAEFEKAISLDPNSFEAYYFYARACVFQGKIDQAAALAERASEIKPDDYVNPCMLIQWYESLGRIEDSLEASRRGAKLVERQLILHPDDGRAAELGSTALIKLGDKDRAREWIARALSIEPENPVTRYNAACGFAQLGDFDRAFELLHAGLAMSGPEWGRWVEHDSTLDPLRNDPRYQRFMEALHRREKAKD